MAHFTIKHCHYIFYYINVSFDRVNFSRHPCQPPEPYYMYYESIKLNDPNIIKSVNKTTRRNQVCPYVAG